MTRNAKGHGSAPRVTPRISQALDLLLSGQVKTITEAAAKIGIRRENISRALGKPHVQAEIDRRVRQRISTIGQMTASASLELLARAAESEYVKADVAKHILSINGVKPKADSTQGSTGGIAFRLVVGGQAVDIAAVFGAGEGPDGATLVQISDQPSQPIDITPVSEAVPYLWKVVRDDEGGRG